jgi:polyferredoxin
MLVLGFIYTAPLTISHVIALLSGFWPDWHSNIYWYLLIGGILFATTVDAKNPYCSWFCPFGAYQECLAAFTGSGLVKPRRWRVFLNWLPRTLALASILLGLATRQPGVASYEPFAALFDLRGSALNFALLGVVTLGSLLMYRPFCNYLCPLGPVIDFVAAGRRWVRDLWRKDWNANSES